MYKVSLTYVKTNLNNVVVVKKKYGWVFLRCAVWVTKNGLQKVGALLYSIINFVVYYLIRICQNLENSRK